MRGITAGVTLLAAVVVFNLGLCPHVRAQSLFERLVDKIEEAAERNAERQDSRPYNGRENFDDAAPRRVFVALQPPAAPAPEAPSNRAPKATAKLNSLGFLVRAASRAEVAAVKEQMSDLQDDLLADLEDVLKDSLPSTSKIAAELAAKSVDAEHQSQVLAAVKSHNADQLQVLWVTLMKDSVRADELQKQVVLADAFASLKDNVGDLAPRDIKHFRRSLEKSGVTGNVRRDTEKSVKRLETTITLLEEAGSGSTDATLKKAAIPSGAVEVLCNPKLMKDVIVELGNGHYMLGTGEGQLELQSINLAAKAGYLVVGGQAVSSYEEEPVTTGVLLRCQKDADTKVEYRLFRTVVATQLVTDEDGNSFNQNVNTEESHDYSMSPGESQRIYQEDWKCDFNRGGAFGRTTYPLPVGTFEFRPSDKGWELYNISKEFTVTIDNTNNKHSFEYVMNEKAATVRGGESKSHTLTHPAIIRFNRGAAGEEKSSLLEKGSFSVALNSEGSWDIFEKDVVDAAAPKRE